VYQFPFKSTFKDAEKGLTGEWEVLNDYHTTERESAREREIESVQVLYQS
jgi:hypothetical protein